MNSTLKAKFQDCVKCSARFLSSLTLDLHMQRLHREHKDTCTPCNIKFENYSQLEKHMKTFHKGEKDNKSNNRGVKRELESNEDKVFVNKKNAEYTKEIYPDKDDDDNEDEESHGITFKGKSRKYTTAYNRLREKMVQGAEFQVKKNHLKITNAPKGKPMKVEITNEEGEKGQAQIQMYKPGKRGATVLITRSSGESFEVVETVADEFIEVFLDAFLKGLIKGEEEMEKYIKSAKADKVSESFKCDICEKGFSSKQGLRVHSSWHIRKDKPKDEKPNDEKPTDEKPKDVKPKEHTFIRKSLQQSICELCDEKFTADFKYKTIQALLTHKKTCTFKTSLNAKYRIKRDCDECDFKASKEKDMKGHMRDEHLNLSTSISPPPKRKRASVIEEAVEEMIIDPEDNNLNLKLEDMDIKEKDESEEETERKRLSLLMDQKVEQINRKREQDEKKEQDRKIAAELKRNEEEEVEKERAKEELAIKKNAAKKQKARQKKVEDLKKLGITEIDKKLHDLVGKYKYKLNIPGNGSCQASAKAACLLGDPRAGLQLAIEENAYIVEHWKGYFEKAYTFPHTLILRGGKTKTCKDEDEFLTFLILNPEVSYMWADHQQLQVTANLYNTTVQVLMIDEKGNGRLLHEAFKPDPRLVDFSFIPAIKPTGEKMDAEEVWLMYTNGNHYDALVSDDGKIMELGTVESIEKGKAEVIDLEKIKEPSEIVVKESTKNKPKDNPLSFSQIAKGERLSTIVKQVLESESNDNVDTDTKEKLKESNSKLEKIEKLYKESENEVARLQEEKDDLKIQVKDLTDYIELDQNERQQIINKPKEKIVRFHKDTNKDKIFKCDECEYPFKEIAVLFRHKEKHRATKQIANPENSYDCNLCKKRLNNENLLKQHILHIHGRSKQYNCDCCDFQGSSQIILNKHINTKHRDQDNQLVGTLKCQDCNAQFSAKWNLMNHKRDVHKNMITCKFFQEKRCKFSEDMCWYKHTEKKHEAQRKDKNVLEVIQCHVCDQKFRKTNDMMQHKKTQHPDQVRECKANKEGNCSFGNRCWYIHKDLETEINVEDNEYEDIEPENNATDFQENSENLAPPLRNL